MSTIDLEPIKERLDKAHTEWGPWKAKEDSWDGYSVVIDDNGPGVSIIAEQIGQGEDEGRGDAEGSSPYARGATARPSGNYYGDPFIVQCPTCGDRYTSRADWKLDELA